MVEVWERGLIGLELQSCTFFSPGDHAESSLAQGAMPATWVGRPEP